MQTTPILSPMPRHLVLLPELPVLAGGQVVERHERLSHGQGYRLEIADGMIMITAGTPVGFFYARQTLAQLRRQYTQLLPSMQIDDFPDFPVRGVMLDISRDKVPTMATLYRLVDQLAELKINQLQLYTEHTFAYREHRKVWSEASPITAEEIRSLDAYCRERFIELVPNQNSFGHMERWLKHPEYRHLAEAPDGFVLPWGVPVEYPFSLCPTEPRSLDFLQALYAELLPNFSSSLFNVGCDETFDLGQGRSRADVERAGSSTRIYLDFLKKVHALVSAQGRTMMFWGDIIVHQPDLIGELPRSIIAMEWGYEADSPFDRNGQLFVRVGIPFYVCPGTSSWCSIAGRTDNCLANLRNAAENGLKHGACGYLNTDWGDHGHLQYLPVSYLPFVAGAAYSWCLQANRNLPLAEVLNQHVFRDPAGIMAKVAMDLGNVYQSCGKLMGNCSVLFRILVSMSRNNPTEGLARENLEQAIHAIDAAIAPIEQAKMELPDARLIMDEFRNAAAILRYACYRGIALIQGNEPPKDLLQSVIQAHRELWFARNREGGLCESVARLATGRTRPTA